MMKRNIGLEVRLIDDLLDLSRIRRGSLHLLYELVDAHQLVENVIDLCRDDLGNAKLQLNVDLAAASHHVSADPIRFQQALWNLIKNAIKFTPPGGRVTVRSHNGDAEKARREGVRPELLIEVSDTGIGIAPELLPSVFDVLEQGGISNTRRFGGLGLGLTIARSILEHHGGQLKAHSRGRGRGATFSIAVRTAPSPPPGSSDDAPAATPIAHDAALDRPIRLLLVDDNHDTLKSLSRLLTLRGHHVHTAADMASALQVARQVDFDLIVSDIELPDGSGLELLWTLRATRTVPAIALSGFGATSDIEQSRAAGFAVHLTKPVDFRELDAAIRQCASAAMITTVVESS